MVTILQGSVETQTMLGGLIIYPLVTNFLWCICAKNYYENWLAVDKVIAEISRLTFFAHPVCQFMHFDYHKTKLFSIILLNWTVLKVYMVIMC